MKYLEEKKSLVKIIRELYWNRLKKKDKLWTSWFQRKVRKEMLGILFRNVLQKRK